MGHNIFVQILGHESVKGLSSLGGQFFYTIFQVKKHVRSLQITEAQRKHWGWSHSTFPASGAVGAVTHSHPINVPHSWWSEGAQNNFHHLGLVNQEVWWSQDQVGNPGGFFPSLSPRLVGRDSFLRRGPPSHFSASVKSSLPACIQAAAKSLKVLHTQLHL